MEEGEHKEKCFFCGKLFNYGLHRWDGEFVPHYKLLVCFRCQKLNADGLNPIYDAKFEAHLDSHNILRPPRDINGYYEIPKK
ncbi:hypothetical protein KP004_01345 [Geomonas oryzisoli]|uniref:Uncharacterized protein n=1 Tax=Geomonas oryzisoli TaxID=2847992 RepID=A0ABX8J7R9_9BACT|nr:hypothetical protein [Geomonas oryzisoli]QWV93868.1 hypothetical protein KP004_01345 [Geomonas oryzisoli]